MATTITPNVENNINFLNSFIDKIKASQDSIFCDATCQYNKKEELLKRNYDNAIVNYKQGPNHINTTFKDYYIFKNGEASYKEEIEKKYTNEANIMINKFKENAAEIRATILKNLEIYNINMKYLTDIYPAFYIYNENNIKKQQEIIENRSTAITNKRKSYYENEGIENTVKNNQIMQILYFFIAIISIFYVYFTGTISVAKKIILSIIILFYPFYISFLYSFIVYIYNSIISLLPLNIYLQK